MKHLIYTSLFNEHGAELPKHSTEINSFNPHSKMGLRIDFLVIKFTHYVFVEHLPGARHSVQGWGPRGNHTDTVAACVGSHFIGKMYSKGEDTTGYKLGKHYKRSKGKQ